MWVGGINPPGRQELKSQGVSAVRGLSLLTARDMRQTRISGPAFPFSLFPTSLSYKELKTCAKISIWCLSYFLHRDLTSFSTLKNNKTSESNFFKVLKCFIIKHLIHTEEDLSTQYSAEDQNTAST